MFALTVRVMLGTVLIAAAAGKVRSRDRYAEFAAWVGDLPIPGARARPLPVLAVGAEVLIALCLPPGITAPCALAAAAGLFAVFAGTAARVRRSGLAIDCHCFGVARGQLGLLHVARDGALAAAALGAALADLAHVGAPAGVAESCTFAVLGLVLGGFVVSLENVIALLAGPSRYSAA
jgi:hypothetical protein